jgi:hypothetical protein
MQREMLFTIAKRKKICGELYFRGRTDEDGKVWVDLHYGFAYLLLPQ